MMVSLVPIDPWESIGGTYRFQGIGGSQNSWSSSPQRSAGRIGSRSLGLFHFVHRAQGHQARDPAHTTANGLMPGESSVPTSRPSRSHWSSTLRSATSSGCWRARRGADNCSHAVGPCRRILPGVNGRPGQRVARRRSRISENIIRAWYIKVNTEDRTYLQDPPRKRKCCALRLPVAGGPSENTGATHWSEF